MTALSMPPPRPALTPLFVGPLALGIGAMFVAMLLGPTLFGWSDPMPVPLRVVVGLFAAMCLWGGVASLLYYVRLRSVFATVSPALCRIRIESVEFSDSTSHRAHVRIGGRDFRVAVRGGKGLAHAIAAGARDVEIDAAAWVEPETGLPIALAVAGPDGRALVLDTYGAARTPAVG